MLDSSLMPFQPVNKYPFLPYCTSRMINTILRKNYCSDYLNKIALCVNTKPRCCRRFFNYQWKKRHYNNDIYFWLIMFIYYAFVCVLFVGAVVVERSRHMLQVPLVTYCKKYNNDREDVFAHCWNPFYIHKLAINK